MLIRPLALRRLCHARDRLRERHEPSPSIGDLARELQVSPFHFIRQFEAVFGLTPHQYRIQARLDAAKQLLAAGHHSVTDVCMEVGFSSLGSFSALFMHRIGETPSAYRRRVRALIQVPGAAAGPTPGCLSLMAHLPASAFACRPRNFREA